MSIQQIVDVPANGKLQIKLPDSLKHKKVKVTIEKATETIETKVARLKMALNDKDFLADLEEVKKDFEFAESRISE